jgi:hypothetical protein
MKYLKKHWWDVVFIGSLTAGFASGIWGFTELSETQYGVGGALWETFRLFDREYHAHDVPPGLAAAQWLLLFAFLWLSLKVIITIIAPDLISNLVVRLFYRNHIVICGSGGMASALVDANAGRRIIVLAESEDDHSRALRHRGVKLVFCGERFDAHFLRRAKIGLASRVWIATGDDGRNVEVAETVFSIVSGGRRNGALKCYTVIEDRALKGLLDETRLFKYRTDGFDPTLFNIDEMGVKYAIAMNIEGIVPAKPDTVPEILVAGLTGRAAAVILDLAHCLTPNREPLHFTVVESDAEKVAAFRKKYPWLDDFAAIEYVEEAEAVCARRRFASVFVCLDNRVEAVRAAISIRNAIGDDRPDIFLLYSGAGGFIEMLDPRARNIVPTDTLHEAVRYVVELDPQVEEHARAAHDSWRKRDVEGNFAEQDEYHTLSAHFKQTNRNQVLDNYLRTWIVAGERFGAARYAPVAFSDHDIETLAMMEHRRWMIEKLDDGWRYAPRSDTRFKRRNNLVPWDELPDDEKKKDYDAITLMIKLLNTPPDEKIIHPGTTRHK